VTLRAVQKAIHSGRIHREPDGRVNSDEADREWSQNTRLGVPYVAAEGPPNFTEAEAWLEALECPELPDPGDELERCCADPVRQSVCVYTESSYRQRAATGWIDRG
jgi:hypothetical protein